MALLDLWIEEHIAYHDWPGLALGIVHRGELVWAKGYGFADAARTVPVTPRTLHRLGSVSKLFTATAILQLRDAGALALDDPVTRHLPSFAVGAASLADPPITLRHLLTHTSGLPREGAFPYWTTHEFPSKDELLAAVERQELLSRPGAEYRYSNLGMSVLGAVVEEVAGMPWARWVRERIALPLGMADTTAAPGREEIERLAVAWMRRRPGGERRVHDYYETGGLAPAAAVLSTIEDLARFAALQLGDEAAGAGVLAAASVEEMQRPHFVHPSWSGGRGLGFGLSRLDGETVVSHGGWIGGHRSHLLIDERRDVAVVALTNADDMSPWFFSRRAWELVAPALAGAGGAEAAGAEAAGVAADGGTASGAETAAAAPADAAFDRLVGLYSDPWDYHYRVMVHAGDLVVYEHSYPPTDDPAGALTRLTPEGGDRFRMPDGDPVVFELDEEGRVVRVQRRSDFLFPVAR